MAEPCSPLQITYLVSVLGGGTGHHLLSMLSDPETSWDSRIISEQPNTSRWQAPVLVEQLPRLPRISRFPVSQILRWRDVRTIVCAWEPDILHCYFFWSIIYGRLLKARGEVRHLVENREDQGFAWGPMEYSLLRMTGAHPDRVICVCDAVRDVVIEREKLPPDRLEVIPNGISRSRDVPAHAREAIRGEFGIPTDAPVIGMVANYDRAIKGASYFTDALPGVVKRFPDVRFLLVGMGDSSELQARAERLGVARNLVVTGFRRDIEAIYEAMDVSVLTSLSEGLSITVLESMRAGLPVVATRVGGNPDLVRHGETGLLVEPGSAAAVADAVIRILGDEELRRGMGRAAVTRVREKFSLSGVARRYADTYSRVAEG